MKEYVIIPTDGSAKVVKANELPSLLKDGTLTEGDTVYLIAKQLKVVTSLDFAEEKRARKTRKKDVEESLPNTDG